MAFIVAEDTIKCILYQDFQGEIVENILWFQSTIPITNNVLEDIGSNLRLWWVGEMKLLLSARHALIAIHSVQQDANNSPANIENVTGAEGEITGVPLSGSVALCVTFQGPLRGKSYRGRMYLSGLPETAIEDTTHTNAANGSFVADVLAAFGTLASYVGVGSGTPYHVISSHYADHLPRAFAFNSAVVSYAANQYFDSQRRRLHGRGI